MKRIKILAVTSTRAEYGILKNILRKISDSPDFELFLVVTGMHLDEKFGMTVREIEEDNIPIFAKIPISVNTSSESRITEEMSNLTCKLGKIIAQQSPKVLLILGDRYEILAAASAALCMNIPIAHISGGEITEGAIDNKIRNAISQMAQIHFPGAEAYAENLVKMGIEAKTIFNVGDPAIENIKNLKYLSSEELEKELGLPINNTTLLVTYHPVTLELESLQEQISNLINALSDYNGPKLITYPNSDVGNEIIVKQLIEFAAKDKSVKLVKSLGATKYLSVMKLCGAVVGNSSSAIIEAPVLKKPAVNIGNRQKGRLMADCIINCGYKSKEITEAINKALSPKFSVIAQNTQSLYGEGNSSQKIVDILTTLFQAKP